MNIFCQTFPLSHCGVPGGFLSRIVVSMHARAVKSKKYNLLIYFLYFLTMLFT